MALTTMMLRLWWLICIPSPCQSQAGIPEQIYDVTWKESYEENTDSTKIYRSAEHKFPLSRGRESFVMHKNGAFMLNAIGAADGRLKIEGAWKLDANGISVFFAKMPERNFKFRILSVDGAVLKITRPKS